MTEPLLTRRSFLVATAVGLGTLSGALSACSGTDESPEELRVLLAPWIQELHPTAIGQIGLAEVGAPLVTSTPPQEFDLAAVGGRGAKPSGWNLFVGATPFADVGRLVARGALAPWDDVLDEALIADLHPSVRAECSSDGRLYAWPFVVDLVVQAWNAELVERAGLDPSAPPRTFDELVANARAVVRSGAAPFGCTFDPRPWRSLVPIAAALSGRVPVIDGLVDLRSAEVREALEVLIRLRELANPDLLDPTTTPGAGVTADEGVFAAQTAAYYLKYQNAPIRLAGTWPDPTQLALAGLPSSTRTTVFWSSGVVRLDTSNPRGAARYADALTGSQAVWRASLGGGRSAAGQLPARRSLLDEWRREGAAWLPRWAGRLFQRLDGADHIPMHPLGARQFTIAQPWIEQALVGDETPTRALDRAMMLVRRAATG